MEEEFMSQAPGAPRPRVRALPSPVGRSVFLDADQQLAALRRPLLLSHTKPDGDALGSLLAMRSVLRARGAQPLAIQFDPTPQRYAALHHYEPMRVWGREASLADLAGVDGVVVLDTCTYNQLEPLADWLRASRLPKIAVDHHVTRDKLADVYVVDESAAATCLILHDWSIACDWALDAEACAALFIGVSTDTGWFRHSNTDARALEAAADLVGRGVHPHELFQELYQTDSAARVRLLGELLSTMDLLAGDRLALLTLPATTLSRLGARMSDTEDMINEPLRIATVRVSVLLADQGDGLIRVSFRSKPPVEPGDPDFDVAAVAQHFGGGGHRRAAGARLRGGLDEARKLVVAHLLNLMAVA